MFSASGFKANIVLHPLQPTLGEVRMLSGGRLEGNKGACALKADSINCLIIGGVGSGFFRNSAESDQGGTVGGAVCADSVGDVLLTDGARAEGNSALGGNGGFLSVGRLSSLTLDNASVSNNSAAAGGAVHARLGVLGSVVLRNGSAANGNVALAGSGGFVYAEDGLLVRRERAHV
jgi:predicted outer membrane repeat protein